MLQPKYKVGDMIPCVEKRIGRLSLSKEIKVVHIGKHEISYGVRFGRQMRMIKEKDVDILREQFEKGGNQ